MGLLISNTSCINKPRSFVKNKIWEEFKTKLKNRSIDYLVENSFDSIKCIGCVSNKIEKLHQAEFIFKYYNYELYNTTNLNKKEYSVYQNDSILRINYSFENKHGDESFNIIYMFNKSNDKFLFSGMITVP